MQVDQTKNTVDLGSTTLDAAGGGDTLETQFQKIRDLAHNPTFDVRTFSESLNHLCGPQGKVEIGIEEDKVWLKLIFESEQQCEDVKIKLITYLVDKIFKKSLYSKLNNANTVFDLTEFHCIPPFYLILSSDKCSTLLDFDSTDAFQQTKNILNTTKKFLEETQAEKIQEDYHQVVINLPSAEDRGCMPENSFLYFTEQHIKDLGGICLTQNLDTDAGSASSFSAIFLYPENTQQGQKNFLIILVSRNNSKCFKYFSKERYEKIMPNVIQELLKLNKIPDYFFVSENHPDRLSHTYFQNWQNNQKEVLIQKQKLQEQKIEEQKQNQIKSKNLIDISIKEENRNSIQKPEGQEKEKDPIQPERSIFNDMGKHACNFSHGSLLNCLNNFCGPTGHTEIEVYQDKYQVRFIFDEKDDYEKIKTKLIEKFKIDIATHNLSGYIKDNFDAWQVLEGTSFFSLKLSTNQSTVLLGFDPSSIAKYYHGQIVLQHVKLLLDSCPSQMPIKEHIQNTALYYNAIIKLTLLVEDEKILHNEAFKELITHISTTDFSFFTKEDIEKKLAICLTSDLNPEEGYFRGVALRSTTYQGKQLHILDLVHLTDFTEYNKIMPAVIQKLQNWQITPSYYMVHKRHGAQQVIASFQTWQKSHETF